LLPPNAVARASHNPHERGHRDGVVTRRKQPAGGAMPEPITTVRSSRPDMASAGSQDLPLRAAL